MSGLDSLASSLFASTSPPNPPAPHLKPSEAAVGSPPPAPLPPPLMAVTNPLFLSIDAGVTKYRACVLDEKLRVIWTADVDVDDESPEYRCVRGFAPRWKVQVESAALMADDVRSHSTRDGVHTLGDVVTSPSELRLHALDVLLEKLTRDSPDPTLVSRIACISGCGQVRVRPLHRLGRVHRGFRPQCRVGKVNLARCPAHALPPASQPNTLHYLSHSFPTLLASLQHSPQSRISSTLSSQTAFSLASPATSGDTSASSQVRDLEMHFGKLAIAQAMAEEGEEGHKPLPNAVVFKAGRNELVRRTGGKVTSRSPVSQLLKVVQEKAEEKEGVLERTGRIALESGLLASVFLGE